MTSSVAAITTPTVEPVFPNTTRIRVVKNVSRRFQLQEAGVRGINLRRAEDLTIKRSVQVGLGSLVAFSHDVWQCCCKMEVAVSLIASICFWIARLMGGCFLDVSSLATLSCKIARHSLDS